MRQGQRAPLKKNSGWGSARADSRRENHGGGFVGGIVKIVVIILVFWLFGQFAVRPAVSHITSNQIFTVRKIVVTGSEYLNEKDISKAAENQVGKNIFEVDLAAIAEQLEKNYAAEDFTVFKCLPGTITIRIHERQPVALLNLQTLVGVDKNGVPLPHIGAEMVDTLPIVTGIRSVASLSDSTVRNRLVTGLRLLNEMKDKSPSTYRRISELNVSSLNTLGVSLVDNGLEVIIGDSDWIRKLPVLDKVITEVTYKKEKVKKVDIRVGETIFVQ